MSLAYHWTPAEIVELTPPQLALYLAESAAPESQVAMSVDEGLAYIAQRRELRTAWVEEVLLSRSEAAPHGQKTSRAGKVLPTPTNSVIERTNVVRESQVLRQREPLARRVQRAREVRLIEQRARTDERRVVNVFETRGSVSTDPVRVTSSSPTGSQVLFDELRHRLTLLDGTTSAIEVAVERLRRKQSDSARFS